MKQEDLPRGIIIAGTPLGNPGDASPRLCHALANADLVAAEDTRRTKNLAKYLGITIRGQVVSNFDHNEESRVTQLLEAAAHGSVLVVSDAGMPLVSDPGHSVVSAAHDAGIPVTCIPGPSAVTTALALSGLAVGTFAFDGFAPRKQGARRSWLESLKNESRAVCFFESPHRIAETLAAAVEVLGCTRRAAVCRELTKTYEEVKRGSLGELADWAAEGLKGEITVVLEGASAASVDPEDLVALVEERVAAGEKLKNACRDLAAKAGAVSSRELYQAVLDQRSASQN